MPVLTPSPIVTTKNISTLTYVLWGQYRLHWGPLGKAWTKEEHVLKNNVTHLSYCSLLILRQRKIKLGSSHIISGSCVSNCIAFWVVYGLIDHPAMYWRKQVPVNRLEVYSLWSEPPQKKLQQPNELQMHGKWDSLQEWWWKCQVWFMQSPLGWLVNVTAQKVLGFLITVIMFHIIFPLPVVHLGYWPSVGTPANTE